MFLSLDTYIGPETPNPLFVTILRSKNELPIIQTVLAEHHEPHQDQL